MPNLEGLGLQNFRTFTKKENLEFAPITLITGTNNAGKSSVFKAIQFLVHNFKEGIVSDILDFNSMRHELGNLERTINRTSLSTFKKLKSQKSQNIYSRLSDFYEKKDTRTSGLPIFEEDEDLVFAFPLKFGNSREINATLEFRYGLNRFVRKNETREDVIISLEIKNIAILINGEYLHWSNIVGYMENYEDGSYWEMKTSIDIKKIIKLIVETPFKEIRKDFKPNEKTEKYFTSNLFDRIKDFKQAFFDLQFFKTHKDGYEDFTENFIKGKSLFSDYSKLTQQERSKLSAIEQKVTTEFLEGRDNNQDKVLECFKRSFINIFDSTESDIVRAELKNEKLDEQQETNEEKSLRDRFKKPMHRTTPNSNLFSSILRAIEKDFSDIVQRKIDSFKKVYFLPTTRGRNREWFIDEQNSEDIQIVRDFSALYLENGKPIQNFVNFWIGKGEIDELDKNGKKKQKGFKLGKELSVFRDETIGLTKIFLINFDGTKTPLVDLGYGVSQLLPIIMKIATIAHKHQSIHEYDYHQEGYPQQRAIYFTPSTLLIEEPEANLHPSLQSKMAELFIDAASRFNIQFLLETHSEYLIYKFQEYVGQKIVSPENIKMYYFNHPNDVRDGLKDRYISEVLIDKDGNIDYEKYFGEGFFDEQNNLKLSLLNIQRDSFIEDFDKIKDELKKSNETLEGYDVKIGELSQELSASAAGNHELEERLETAKKEKEEKELEFQELLRQQEDIIDEYTAKTNYSSYVLEIETILDKTKIDNSKTLQYLSTGKFLLKNLASTADFAPVIIQYGRAVEFQMIKWMDDFKNTISISNMNNWCDDTNYKDKIRQVFTDLGITLDSSNSTWVINPDRKINLFNLKNYMNSDTSKWKFGGLTQIFELFYFISPVNSATYNYNSVPLMVAFSNYLKNIWRDYDTAEGLFDTCRNILDLRNCAGHTYSDSVCTSNIIDKHTAENYVAKVEAIFGCL